MSAEEPMVSLTVQRTIAAPPEAVFDWLVDANNLKHGRVVLRVRRTRDGAGSVWGKGARRVVTSIGGWFREDITEYERPHRYGYFIVKTIPPMRHYGGSITVTPVDAGSHVSWQSSYDLPAITGGRFAAPLTKRMFVMTFGQILRAA
ncbi:MAG: SRPBCC family protein, partial [Pseudonocardiaceae bacterium]